MNRDFLLHIRIRTLARNKGNREKYLRSSSLPFSGSISRSLYHGFKSFLLGAKGIPFSSSFSFESLDDLANLDEAVRAADTVA